MSMQVPLGMIERAGISRRGEPVRVGVPLPKGALPLVGEDRMSLSRRLVAQSSDGRSWPVQARVLGRWSDGSCRWLLVDLLADVGAHEQAQVWIDLHGADPPDPVSRTAVTANVEPHEGGGWQVDTGVARFVLARGGPSLLASVHREARSWLAPSGLCMRLETSSGHAEGIVESLAIVDRGPLRVVLRAEGRFSNAGRPRPLEFQAHLHFAAGTACIQVDFRIRNPNAARHPGGLWDLGDLRSVQIRELALQTQLAERAEWIEWSADTSAAPTRRSAKRWSLYQDSSGGERWDSPNHLGADGAPTVSFRGYRIADDGFEIAVGDRAQPWLALHGRETMVAATVRDFWQNFPKALRQDGSTLTVSLFPRESRSEVELQGGEQKRHTVWFDFAPLTESDRIAARRMPLQVILDPEWVARTGAAPYFTAPAVDNDRAFLEYVHTLFDGPHSIAAGRDAIDEYGWRNHGDTWADHEAVNHRGAGPFVSHYNNQYDVLLTTLLHGLRAARPDWLALADDLARHVADIDLYHTGDDRPAFNGGLFWHTDHYVPAGLATHRTYSRHNARGGVYGGGPSNEHNYTSGLLLHHFLTGDPDSAEAVKSLADYVIAVDDGTQTLLGLIDPGPTGGASHTVEPGYHKAGRGAGNSINALLDAYLLTNKRFYLRKAEELIERCAHPRDDIASLQLDQPERRWSYLVFLQVLARYLDQKAELGEYDYCHAYAQETLLHYVRWIREHELPYRQQLHKVLLPTETWPAHDMRKAHVLAVAASLCDTDGERDAFHARAAEFYRAALDDVRGFPTAMLLRPRIIIGLYGLAYRASIDRQRAANAKAQGVYDFGSPQSFVPQRSRWRETFVQRRRAAWRDLTARLPWLARR